MGEVSYLAVVVRRVEDVKRTRAVADQAHRNLRKALAAVPASVSSRELAKLTGISKSQIDRLRRGVASGAAKKAA